MFKGDKIRGTLVDTALLGALFVLACDVIGRIVITPYELPIELIIGIAAASFGVFSLLNPGFLMDFLIIVLGLAIAVGSAGSLKRALNLRAFGYSYWWISLVVAMATLIVALTFVFCPEVYGALLMQIIGIILIIEAIGDLLTIHRLSRIARDGGYTIR